MSPRNVQDLLRWYLTGAALWTIYLTDRVDGFAPSRSNRATPFASPTERNGLRHEYCSATSSHSSLSRRMSVAIDRENAVDAVTERIDEIDDEEEEDTSKQRNRNTDTPPTNIYTVRRTAAVVMSIAVQKVVPGAYQSGAMGPSWIDDGFYCDFGTTGEDAVVVDTQQAENKELKTRIKEAMDSIVASGKPVVLEAVSLEEAKGIVGDNKALHQKLETVAGGDGAGGSIMMARVGDDWSFVSLCFKGGDKDKKTILLPSTEDLDPEAIALTAIGEGGKDDNGRGVRITATAWETKSDLVAYKTRAEESLGVVQTFGRLVNWGAGSMDDVEYLCPCCDPTTDGQDSGGTVSVGAFGLPSADAPPTSRVGYGPGGAAAAVAAATPSQPKREQTRLTEESGPKIDTNERPSSRLSEPFVPAQNPEWLAQRETIFDTIRERRDNELAEKPTEPIEVTLPDGTIMGSDHNLTSWRSTPMDVARAISDGLANVAVVARVKHTRRIGDTDILAEGGDGMDDLDADSGKPELWDLTRPLEGDCDVEILTWNSDDEAAKTVFWHSSAHILGQSLEHNYGALLTIGPPVKDGFFYDAYMGDGEGLSESAFGVIEDEFRKSMKRKEKFERLVVTKEEALELFQYSPFKTALIQTKVPENSRTTVYRNGDLIDLCTGPHVPHTGKIKAFKMLKTSAASWLGDASSDQLQRVYGVSFPTKKLLKAHLENLERARERDHRKLGIEQKLFMFHQLSPGSAFFLPHGTLIYNTLCEFLRDQYRKRGYSEVVTPNVFNLKLWEQSGHAQHYKEDMFTFEVEEEEWGMKPMNCPAHCLLFGSSTRSYRDLPMRIADFGVLHRNEASGALTGLTRVRRFQQDDGHVFCREDQIEQEVKAALEFMKFVYDTFGMTYRLELSTRPKKALGKVELWTKAETALANAMDDFAGKGNWRENPGDGAFYGPKIDIKVMDAMDRIHQCATIQLDFQLPIRFDLRYRKQGGDNDDAIDAEASTNGAAEEESQDDDDDQLPSDFARPVMVHRAMLGSVERMFAVLLEHYGGKWPFWLSPRQALVVPVGKPFVEYANTVRDRLHAEGFNVDVDDSSNSLKKKVREGQLAQYNYILVVGEKEATNDSVAVRNRNNEMEGEKKVDELIAEFQHLRENLVREPTEAEMAAAANDAK